MKNIAFKYITHKDNQLSITHTDSVDYIHGENSFLTKTHHPAPEQSVRKLDQKTDGRAHRLAEGVA